MCTYEKNLFFDLNGGSSGESRYRRLILTEDERRLMSETLTTSVGQKSTLDLLFAIDEECETISAKNDFQIRRGPFAAFRSCQSQAAVNSDGLNETAQTTFTAHDQAEEFESLSAEQIMSPNSLALATAFLDQSHGPEMLFPTQDPWEFAMDGSRIQEIFDDLPLDSLNQFPAESTDHAMLATPMATSKDISTDPRTPLTASLMASSPPAVPDGAVPLLKHYQTTVLRSLTPFRHSKTPWHVLFLPQAKNCLAALTLEEYVDSATLCAFYGTLAISAFSLSGVSYSSRWMRMAQDYKQLAHQYIEMALQTAYDVPKKVKYKAVLIALLTMVQLSVICGSPDQIESYFLEAEKFIRLRGLNRKKSRKVRLLHHCYAFERILYESTLLADPSGKHRHHVQRAIEESGTVVVGQDALSFRLGHWTNLEQAMRRIKGPDEGENDLHLQNPGAWSATLYPEIFGVPEQMLLLLSLIVRLAKEKENDQPGIGLKLSEFLERAKSIEQLVQQWQLPNLGSDLENLQQAMYLALSIYFYRRIYNVDASMLQDKVRGVLKCLMQLQAMQNEDSFGAVRYNWPAFIAAREATDPTTQSSFAEWFRDAARHTGLHLFPTTLERIKSGWQVHNGSGMFGFAAMHMRQ